MYVEIPHGVIDKELENLGDDTLAQLYLDSMRELGDYGSEDTFTRFFTIMACARVLEGRGRLDLIEKACEGVSHDSRRERSD